MATIVRAGDADGRYQSFDPPCGEAMGRWQRAALTEGPMARCRRPSTTAYGGGPPPHRFATGKIGVAADYPNDAGGYKAPAASTERGGAGRSPRAPTASTGRACAKGLTQGGGGRGWA